jgi:hypothetical protein
LSRKGTPCRGERGREGRGGTQGGKGTRERVGSDETSVIYMVRRMAEFKKSKNPGHLYPSSIFLHILLLPLLSFPSSSLLFPSSYPCLSPLHRIEEYDRSRRRRRRERSSCGIIAIVLTEV